MAQAGRDRAKVSEGKELDEVCGECGKEVVKEAVECEVCERWFHIKCVGVAAGTYKVLGAEKSIHWFCKGCDKGVVNTWRKLQERQDKLEKELAEVREEVRGLKGKIGKMESGLESNRKEWKEFDKRIKKMEDNDKEKELRNDQMVLKEVEGMKISFKGIVKEQELEREKELKSKDKEIQQKMIEMLEREKRRNNIIIRGINESMEGDEKAEVDRILQVLVEEVSIKYEIVGRVGRLEKEGGVGRCRPLRIRIEELDQKRRLLSRGKNLKEAKDDMLKKVYVAPDLTRLQQEEDKKLRDKLKELREEGMKNGNERTNVKIIRGEIVREVNGGREVLFSLAK